MADAPSVIPAYQSVPGKQKRAIAMILVYLSSGECFEVPEAVAVSPRDGDFVCLDGRGGVLATFEQEKVEAYTSNPKIADAIMDEVCEDLTVIPPAKGGASTSK